MSGAGVRELGRTSVPDSPRVSGGAGSPRDGNTRQP